MTPQTGQTAVPGHDPFGRLKTITQRTNMHTYDYVDNAGMLQKLIGPSGSYTEYEYIDPLKRLTALINKASTGSLIRSLSIPTTKT